MLSVWLERSREYTRGRGLVNPVLLGGEPLWIPAYLPSIPRLRRRRVVAAEQVADLGLKGGHHRRHDIVGGDSLERVACRGFGFGERHPRDGLLDLGQRAALHAELPEP